ncbi:MAG: GNAT family N-acetyltransferase [Proteobacteria bacterium]|nr:GNAT family N-acetyltransferase [Pseudomonadota bacterium]
MDRCILSKNVHLDDPPCQDITLRGRKLLKNERGASGVTLEPAGQADLTDFKRALRESFAVAVIEAFGSVTEGSIPSDQDVDESFGKPGTAIFHIASNGRKVGGVVLSIDDVTHHNALELFFISPAEHGGGIGHKAWQAIEARYPETEVWGTHTPYFEKRNIHFYVNKCGFKIVEFFNAHHRMPEDSLHDAMPGGGEFFRFEKVMR